MKLFGNPIKNLVKTILVFGFTSAMGVTPLFAQVTNSATLAGLTNGETLTIGDKTFSNFSWQASLTDASELNVDAAGLTVSAFIGSDGVYYLDFAGGITVNNLQGNSDLLGNLKLTYTVTANPGSINMIDQQYTPNGTPGSGQIIIGETAKNNQGITVGNSTLTLNPTDLSDPQAEAGDNLNFTGESQLFVVKSILIAADAGNSVGLSDVRQSFHQNSGTLAGLTNGGTLSVGDKTFSGFSYQASGLTSFNPTNIIVAATESNGIDYLTWSGNISLVSGGFASATLTLNYTVTANPGSISMIDQRYIGSVTNGSVLINETVTSADAPTAHSQLSVNDVSDPNTYPSGSFDVGENDLLSIAPPQTTLSVTKGIGLAVISSSGGSITITQVEQSFHQVPPPTLAIQLIDPTMVKVLWPSPSTGWTLWQNTNLGTAIWSSNGFSVSDDNTNKSITISPATGNLFFRLE
jgi:hypothetical protein